MQEIGAKVDSSTAEGSFGNTDWFVVRQAGRLDEPEAEPARSRLCEGYWKPVFNHILRAGYAWHDAQDLTQEFFSRLLKHNSLRTADQDKGKFRSFLLTLLKRFLADQKDHEHCEKRGGRTQIISLNEGDTEFRNRLEPASKLDPETLCERHWVEWVLQDAVGQLERECAGNGREHLFETLKSCVLGEGELTYTAAAAALHLSEVNVRVIVHRLRQRLRQILSEVEGLPASQGQELLGVYSGS